MDYKALLSNETLFIAFRHGDEQAFTAIYQGFRGVIYITVSRIVQSDETAEDITVNTFMRVWERRTGIESMKHLKNLLFVTARNLSLNELRDRSKEYKLTDEVFGEVDRMNHDLYHASELFADLIERAHDIIKQMPEKRGQILRLQFFEELSAEEIAKTLKISKTSVYYHTQEAMRILRSALSGNRPEKRVLIVPLLAMVVKVLLPPY
jgi:RNA polymerase sigma-70 factor (ECF subfamily)